jgi:glycosyltransferase involved in cell wall biosynthesis
MPTSTSTPVLTVAVPTCNGAGHLGEALRGILEQEGVAFELVVSDDRSEDNTLEVARGAAGDRVRIEVNSERLGLAGNWNRCVSLARTPLVAIFHQDDVMLQGHLQAHASALESDESVGLAASGVVVIDERGGAISPVVVSPGGLGPRDRLYAAGELAGQMVCGNPLRCSAVTIRVSAHRDAGGFDPSLRYVVDWDFWLRVSRSWKLAWLAKPTVEIRWHSASETHRFKSGTADLDETARILAQLVERDWRDRPDVTAMQRMADARLGRAFLNRACDALQTGRAELAREALHRAISRSPALIGRILCDPRLCIKLAALAASPRLAAMLFRRRPGRADEALPPPGRRADRT